jgi:hypothetical protein
MPPSSSSRGSSHPLHRGVLRQYPTLYNLPLVFLLFPIEVLQRTTKDASSSFFALRFLATYKLGQASHLGPFLRVYEQGSYCLPSLHAAAQCGSAYLAAELSPTSPCLVGRRFPRPEFQLARLMFHAYKEEGARSAAKLIYLFCSFYCSKNLCHLNHVPFSHSNSISIHSNDFRFLLT